MLMGWKAFARCAGSAVYGLCELVGAAGRQNKFALLGTLLKALSLPGDYALLPEKELFRIALQREDTARAFVDTMQARKTAREDGWAGQWAFVYDDRAEEKIKAVLPPPVRRASSRSSDQRRTSRVVG